MVNSILRELQIFHRWHVTSDAINQRPVLMYTESPIFVSLASCVETNNATAQGPPQEGADKIVFKKTGIKENTHALVRTHVHTNILSHTNARIYTHTK